MQIYENRIIGSKKVKIDEILFNPQNWRTHPHFQEKALHDVLTKVGWVQQIVINQRTGNLIDGHLRCSLASKQGESEIPALIVDLSEEEEKLILATLDPITGFAKTDKEKLDQLLQEIEQNDTDLDELIERVAKQYNVTKTEDDGTLLRKLGIETEAKTNIQYGQVWQLGNHILICCSAVKDVSIWYPYLQPEMLFIPYANPTTLLAEITKTRHALCLNPNQFIAGLIIDRYKEVYQENEVVLL
jgi:hypothetical protein